jgi:hypothetical protein
LKSILFGKLSNSEEDEQKKKNYGFEDERRTNG